MKRTNYLMNFGVDPMTIRKELGINTAQGSDINTQLSNMGAMLGGVLGTSKEDIENLPSAKVAKAAQAAQVRQQEVEAAHKAAFMDISASPQEAITWHRAAEGVGKAGDTEGALKFLNQANKISETNLSSFYRDAELGLSYQRLQQQKLHDARMATKDTKPDMTDAEKTFNSIKWAADKLAKTDPNSPDWRALNAIQNEELLKLQPKVPAASAPTAQERAGTTAVVGSMTLGDNKLGDILGDPKDISSPIYLLTETALSLSKVEQAKALAERKPFSITDSVRNITQKMIEAGVISDEPSGTWGSIGKNAFSYSGYDRGVNPEKLQKFMERFSSPTAIHEFKSVADVDKAKLPKGTEVIINGRRAVVQ